MDSEEKPKETPEQKAMKFYCAGIVVIVFVVVYSLLLHKSEMFIYAMAGMAALAHLLATGLYYAWIKAS